MISKDELVRVADETGLTPAVVEKDYVLGWILAAIAANEQLCPSWVFKGGTCLKKCYFETYRFSEDLDFTLTNPDHLNEEFLHRQFADVSAWIYEQVGLEVPPDRFRFDLYQNPRSHITCQGRIYYRSYFSGGQTNLPKVKLDLTADEVLVMPPATQPVFHAYSDTPADGIKATCYDYPEVFAEKVRALGERGRPRDLYDVINLFRNERQPAAAVIGDVLAQKCAYKSIAVPRLADIQEYRSTLDTNWAPMLNHQLPSLPALDSYWEDLPAFFEWLEGKMAQEPQPLAAVTASGEVYRPAYGQLGLRMANGGSMEIIRFAAGNRLCVDLDYTANNGERSNRIIEPYSLRRATNGNILLYAVRAQDEEIRSYKISQINNASLTNQVFQPRYEVELSPTNIDEPVSSALGTSRQLGVPQRGLSEASVRPRRSSRRRGSAMARGPTYIYRCPYCDKTFRRKTMTGRLNPHNDKDGLPCSGQTGIYEDTRY